VNGIGQRLSLPPLPSLPLPLSSVLLPRAAWQVERVYKINGGEPCLLRSLLNFSSRHKPLRLPLFRPRRALIAICDKIARFYLPIIPTSRLSATLMRARGNSALAIIPRYLHAHARRSRITGANSDAGSDLSFTLILQ